MNTTINPRSQVRELTKINNVQAFHLLNEYFQRNNIHNNKDFGGILKSVIAGKTTYEVYRGRILRIKGEYFIGPPEPPSPLPVNPQPQDLRSKGSL